MQSCRLQGVGSQIATFCALWKMVGKMLLSCVLITGVSSFTMPPEEHTGGDFPFTSPPEAHTVPGDNCRFRGREHKSEYRLEGEPVVLRCPLAWPHLKASAISHTLLTWRKTDSPQLIPGDEPRMWVQDDTLWVLPAMRQDSGIYICTLRNASHCEEMSIELRVFEGTDASLPLISYLQISTVSVTGLLVCPDLKEFIPSKSDAKIQWYKGSVFLDKDNEKFLSVGDPTHLLISNTSTEDAGYYRCVATFTHKGKKFNITRNIELRVKETTMESIPVIISPLETIPASLGSRLIVPCKVFLGTGTPSNTIVWWMANSTFISSAYPEGRVTEGLHHQYLENEENYVEVSLIFDPVTREDLNTDFKCVATNPRSFQSLHTTVKEVSSTFSWGIALAPLSLVFLVLGGIWMHRRCQYRIGKTYGLTKLPTDHQDFPAHPSQIKEMK
ncbi:interleukin-1 receptor type 2 isoform X2 [Nannospalax galili]|uniref:interleukin-1 receptor type 2 isoform X2 n=1 Tax=Nannospalax galili TaxID=1026970 RepID=UPI000819D63F|nr:interleukin-1 receptor type 2 isoform X2 [Nannospalax galili]